MAKLVYLAGSIFNNPDPHTWRDAAKKLLPPGWEAIDPLDFEIIHLKPTELVELDYSHILKCRAILARVVRPSWGTAMELAFARRHNIPVIVWMAKYREGARISPWLLAHFDCAFTTLTEACGELANVG